jgi:putative hydrolase of the HAD superfamily
MAEDAINSAGPASAHLRSEGRGAIVQEPVSHTFARTDDLFSRREGGEAARAFAHIRAWIFDLDNTLYPAECNLFAEVDRRMAEYIQRALGVPLSYARHLQKAYYRQFGTTLTGLMKVHKLDPDAFLDYVHDIDLSSVPAAPALRRELERLPGRRLIFTNGSRRHAECVAEKLGVLDLFEDICDIAANAFVPKPEPDAFHRLVRRHDITATEAAMFDDMPMNLEAPHVLGMTTVLVHSCFADHPVQEEMKRWTALPAHIHHATDDLRGFLAGLSVEAPNAV